MVAMMVPLTGLITDTVPGSPSELATKTSPASGPVGLTATPVGPSPTLTVPTTVLLVVLITDTELLLLLATKTSVPVGLTATPSGTLPTLMVAVTMLVAGLITDTELLSWLVTKTSPASGPVGLTATRSGRGRRGWCR